MVGQPGWVPVDRRFLGLDRRTFTPALVVLAIALVLIYGVPGLNAAIPWHHEIRAGDVLDLGDGGATGGVAVGGRHAGRRRGRVADEPGRRAGVVRARSELLRLRG
ncbi:hypothetical protein ACWEFJ_27400 [Actinosynnema sp. NPDC004786]